MIVLLGFSRRDRGLSGEQLSDHWRNIDGPLLRDTPAEGQLIRRYAQRHLKPNADHPRSLPAL